MISSAFRLGSRSKLIQTLPRCGPFAARYEVSVCALVDGLALHAVSEPARFPPGRIEALVTRELDRPRA